MSTRQRRCSRGFTLLETLVTLVIVSLVAGLLSEGMFQLARLERQLGSGRLTAQLDGLHRLWVQQTIEALQPAAQDQPGRFVGTARSWAGLSSGLPLDERLGPRLAQMELVFVSETGETELRLRHALVPNTQGDAVALARWPGDGARWRYLHPAGQWYDSWPPAMDKAPLLPRAIALEQGEGRGLYVLAMVQSTGQPLGQRLDVEKQP